MSEETTILKDAAVIPFEKKTISYQPNHITESRQEFSEMEKRIVACCLNQLGMVAKEGIHKNLIFVIPFSELTNTNHDKIKKAAESIQTKRIILVNKKPTERNEVYYQSIIPFPMVSYKKIDGRDYLEIMMFSYIVPHFIHLGNQFTKFSIDAMLSMGSNYSQRLYEIMMLHVSRKELRFTYTVEQLKFMLNCPDNYTLDTIKRRALKPAQLELFEKAHFEFTFEPSKKEGKRVLELAFLIKTNQQLIEQNILQEAERYLEQSPDQKHLHLLRLLNEYNFSKVQQDQIIFEKDKWATFLQIDSEIFHGKRVVENPTAYIAKSIGFGVKGAKGIKIAAKKK
jgi:plasmid replication initiation protein